MDTSQFSLIIDLEFETHEHNLNVEFGWHSKSTVLVYAIAGKLSLYRLSPSVRKTLSSVQIDLRFPGATVKKTIYTCFLIIRITREQ